MTAETADMSVIENRSPSVGKMFLDRVAKSGSSEAFRYPEGDAWPSLTWAEAGERVKRMAAGLIALGIESEQRVAIASTTRYEWILADLAVMCAGGATTTVYPSTNAEDVGYIIGDSDSRVVFAEDDDQLTKLREKRSELPEVTKVVTFDGTADDDWVISLDALEKLGEDKLDATPNLIEERVASIDPKHLATLIYTSGTTGRPKGVRIRNDSWTYVAAAIDSVGLLGTDDLEYRWLPMAHSFGKVLETIQLQVGFPAVIDGRVDKIIENLAVVKPTFMGAAPRIFEKAHGRIVTMAESEGGAKAKIFNWAVGVGAKASAQRQAGKEPSGMLAVQNKIATKLVFSKVQARFGGRLRFFISGAAALNREVAEWFHGAGIQILEGYGLTETSAASFVNRPDRYRFGTVGPVVPGTEVKIAEDGEVLIKGPGVMDGYHNMPEATAETLDSDGWLHTGDIGEVSDGFLKITDRKKDLFKTSGGKYIAPSSIESQFKAVCPYASQFVVHGDGRNFVSAIITLDEDAMTQWAEHNGMSGKSYQEVVTSDEVKKMVAGYIEQLNARLNRWETIKEYILLDRDLSVEGGEITPSMKVKRRAVEDKYRKELDALYTS